MLVAVQDEIDAVVEQNPPHVLQLGRRTIHARAEARPMEVRQGAECLVLPQVTAQPIFLRLDFDLIDVLEIELAVEGQEVPAANVVAVVSLGGWTCFVAKVLEVRIATAAVVVVISRRGVDYAHDARASPRRRKAPWKIVGYSLRAGRVSVVTQCGYHAFNVLRAVEFEQTVDDHCRRFVATRAANGDVASTDQHWGAGEDGLLFLRARRSRSRLLLPGAADKQQRDR